MGCERRVGPCSMIGTVIAKFLRGSGAALPVLVLWAVPAAAQLFQQPGTASRSQACLRLESQLAAIDRGGASFDPAKAEQIKRYEDAAAKQQAELDRLGQQSQRLGCRGGGFFALFSGQSPQCTPLNNQIQQVRTNLDRSLIEIQRLQGNSGEREGQRRAVLAALGQNDCGPQYRQYANSGPGGFFENLFGGNFGGISGRFAGGDLPDAVRAHLRRLLLPDLLLHGAGQVRRRRAAVPAPVPGHRGDPLQPPQPRRGRGTRGVEQRQALFRAAHRVQLPQAIQCRLQLPVTRPVLGRGAATSRRPDASSAATSWSPRSARSSCRSRASTRRASRSISIPIPAGQGRCPGVRL